MAEQSKNKQWKVIKDFPAYAVSNYGRVKRIKPYKSTKIGRILKPEIVNGYLKVCLCSSTPQPTMRYVHQLVLEAFVSPRPQGKQCNHKDGNKLNNYVENLEWVTCSQNNQHKFDVLGYIGMQGERHPRAKLTNAKVLQIRQIYKTGNYSYAQLARKFSITQKNVSCICNHKSWKHI